jgi:hypothetical protein
VFVRVKRLALTAGAVAIALPQAYLPPPSAGEPLAALDRAMLVIPPEGMEVGYVPLATKQYYPK